MSRRKSQLKIQADNTADWPPVEVPGMLEDGRIPLALMEQDLEIFIPKTSESRAGDKISLYVYGTLAAEYILTAQDEGNPDFKARFTLPAAIYPPNGSYKEVSLDYRYYFSETGETEPANQRRVVIFDREPPGGVSLPTLLFAPEQEHVTEDDLQDDYLPVLAAPWYGMDLGDVLTPWVSEYAPGSPPGEHFLKGADVVIDRLDIRPLVKFPRSSFEGQGERYFAYRVTDKLGNESALSRAKKVTVDL